MRISLTKQLVTIAFVGVFSQFSMADNAAAAKTIAGVLANLNHFPSDADKVVLMAVAEDERYGAGFRAIARAVHNIQHAATAEDREIMNRVVASNRASAKAKTLAEIVLGISHVPGDEAKTRLAAML